MFRRIPLRRYEEGARVAPRIRAFTALIEEIGQQARHAAPASAIAHALDRSGYLEALERHGGVDSGDGLLFLRRREAAVYTDFCRDPSNTDLDR